MSNHEIVYTDPQRDWVTIARAPFVFRRRRKTGRSGNIYYVSGDSIEQLTAAMNEASPMPGNFWIEVATGGRLPVSVIATATLDPRHGTIHVQWNLRNTGFGMRIPPQEIATMIPRMKTLVSNGGGFEDGDEERRALAFCDGVMNAWDDIWAQFIAAAQEGACNIMARADSPLAPTFSRVPPDVFARFKIDNWAKGDATGPDNAKLFAIHVAPIAQATTVLGSPEPANRFADKKAALSKARHAFEKFVSAYPHPPGSKGPFPSQDADFRVMETAAGHNLSLHEKRRIRKEVCEQHGYSERDWRKRGGIKNVQTG